LIPGIRRKRSSGEEKTTLKERGIGRGCNMLHVPEKGAQSLGCRPTGSARSEGEDKNREKVTAGGGLGNG